MNESWLIYITHMNESRHTREWFMSHTGMSHDALILHIWMSHSTHVSESCRIYEGAMAHSYYTYEWVTAQRESHVTHMNESWLIDITHMNKSCHTCEWVMSLTQMFWCGVATISRLPKNIDLFCKRALWKRLYSAKETYNFKSLLIVATP